MFNSCPFLDNATDEMFQNGTGTIKNINILISKLSRKSNDRVRASQWVIKLKQLDSQSIIRDHYIQLLFSQLSNNRLSDPFLELPPTTPLLPLGSHQPLFQQHSITPPVLSGKNSQDYIHQRSHSIEMSVPFQNGHSHLTPPSRHRPIQNMNSSRGFEDLLESTELLLSQTQPPFGAQDHLPRRYQRDGHPDTVTSLLVDEEDFPPLYEANLSSPELTLSDNNLGDGLLECSSKKRHSDVTDLIGGNLSARLHNRIRTAPVSDRRRHNPLLQDDSLRMILDQKNSELESTKHNYSSKLQEVVSRCRRLEDRLRQSELELGRERDGTNEKLEEQKNLFEKRHNSLVKEYELKMQTFIEDNEYERGDIHKQHNQKLSDVMTSTQDQRIKLESEFAKQARATNRIVQELEIRVKQLTDEVANEAKSRTHIFKEKTELEQRVQSLRHQLDASSNRCEELELEKREYFADYEGNLRKLQNQLEQTIQIAKQEQNGCIQKYNAKMQDLEKQLIQYKNALDISRTDKQQLEANIEQTNKHLSNKDVQLECTVNQAKTEIEQIETRYKQKLRKLESTITTRENTIRELENINTKQTQQAQFALDQFKSQFEKNSSDIYKQMKQQLEKVEQDLETSRQVREKQCRENMKQREIEKKQNTKEIEILKVKFGKERQQILKDSEDMKIKLELKLTEERDKILRNTQEKVSRNENEFRLKCQEDSNRINTLECELKEARDQLATQQTQYKSQLLEVSMMREEEKQNNNRIHQNLISKFKGEIDDQRRQIESQYSDRAQHQQQQTDNKLQELESANQERLLRIQQKLSTADNEIKYLKEDLLRNKATYEEHIRENTTHHEHSLDEVRKSHDAGMRSLQQESDTNREMVSQIEKRCHQLEVESEQKLSHARLRYEDKLSGLLPHSIRRELEDTIMSLKAQVSSLNERCILLQEQVAKKRGRV
ncbi:Centrosomal protein [Oopsacas minuta]|uniref:Centrosomal protein n=1 Tax=Oopsacas minuta TaxID=111878 RepID=A0AAV7JWS7_9METZ|nr:Centrosomal protein [Oopsacas minuta]